MAVTKQNQKIIDYLKSQDLNKYENLYNLFSAAVNIKEEDLEYSLILAQKVKAYASRGVRREARFEKLYYDAMLFRAPYKLDDYILYMEKDKPYEKRFYQPRRFVLQTVVSDLQELEEGKFHFYGLSMPTRTGKSTTCIFFLTWAMGRNPDKANLMSGHSDDLTNGFYKEALNFIESSEYHFFDIFPNVKFESKSADKEAINLNTRSRFPTLTCRAIGATLTGAVEAENYLYCDDLVKNREESLSPIRLRNKYQAYLNELVDRKIDGCKELMVGTRWNVLDPLGIIEKENKDNPDYRFRKLPAINEDGESNFQYKIKGFSTAYYLDIKNRLDKNEWEAKYQQRPFVREGILFPEDSLHFYNGILPETGLERIIAVCDVAWGGGDSLSMPFAYVYDDGRVFIHDWIFNKGDKTVTKPIVVGKTLHHRPNQEHYEANNGGDEYADSIDQMLQEQGFKTNITSAKADNQVSKLAKIIQYAPDIINNFYFLDEKHRDKEYQDAIDELTMFVQIGKNEHDDACDALSQLQKFIEGGMCVKVKVGKRPF